MSLISNKQDDMPCMLSICRFQHVKQALEFRTDQSAHQRSFHVIQGSKGLHIKDLLCTRSEPLNPPTLMCHTVAPFSSLLPTLSLTPMEVIKRALFRMITEPARAGHYDCLVSYATLSAGHWRWLRSTRDTQNSLWGLLCNKNQNNDEWWSNNVSSESLRCLTELL